MSSASPISIRIVLGDVLGHQCDVLVLKHAQALHGADEAVHRRLSSTGNIVELPPPGQSTFAKASDAIGAQSVLFLGVESIGRLNYGDIRAFGRRALSSLMSINGKFDDVALTVHGPGFGLDEIESFESELAGIVEAISAGEYPKSLRHVTFVERDSRRANRLGIVLNRLIPGGAVNASGGLRIAGAELVVADLTHANPNVYLEVGYAWAKDIPTILLSRAQTDLQFDTRGQRCILYSSIRHLEEQLKAELAALVAVDVADASPRS